MRKVPEIGPLLIPTIIDILASSLRRWLSGAVEVALIGGVLLIPISLYCYRKGRPPSESHYPRESRPVTGHGDIPSEEPEESTPHRVAGAVEPPVGSTQVSPDGVADAKPKSRRND
jgi:hypothetical protein